MVLDPNGVGADAGHPKNLTLADVGTEPSDGYFSWVAPYLTADEQRALVSVAWSTEPVQLFAGQIEWARKRRNRFRPLIYVAMAPALVAALSCLGIVVLTGASIFHATTAPSGAVSFLALTMTAALIVMVLSTIPIMRTIPRGRDAVLLSILAAIRAADQTDATEDNVAGHVEGAANVFYDFYRRDVRRGRRGPRSHQQRRDKAAYRGAAGIASQLVLIDRLEPDYLALADNLRRALLRVSCGHWREVELLNISGSDVWVPRRWSRARVMLSQEPTQKIAVAVAVGLIAILAALLSNAVRLLFDR